MCKEFATHLLSIFQFHLSIDRVLRGTYRVLIEPLQSICYAFIGIVLSVYTVFALHQLCINSAFIWYSLVFAKLPPGFYAVFVRFCFVFFL